LRWAFNKDKTVAETFQNVNDPLLYGMGQKEKKTLKDSKKGVGLFFSPIRRKIEMIKKMDRKNPPVLRAFSIDFHSEGKSLKSITSNTMRRMVKTSKSLSITMVANEELLLMFSIRPMWFALINSPSRAGKTQFAAKPITVEENRLNRPIFFIGSKR